MTARERLLAIVVGGLLLVLSLLWIGERVNGAFRKRTALQGQLAGQLEQKRMILQRARRTSRELEAYEKMSLPANVEVARSQYQAWLSELVQAAELEDPQVKVTSQSRRYDGSTNLTCSVSGKGNLLQLARLLYDFYSVKCIHRIHQLPLKPVADSKMIDIRMTVDALILSADARSTAEELQSFERLPSAVAAVPMEKAIQPITKRYMFGPANKPPSILPISSQTAYLNEPISLTTRAADEDPLDKLTFRLVNGPPEARIDPASGRLIWTPTEAGDYELTVAVADDGIPSLSGERTITVSVTNQPKPSVAEESAKPGVDDAKFTYAIAALEISGQRQLWLQIRTHGQILKLSEGDPVKIGSVDAVVSKIDAHTAELLSDGQTQIVKIGDPLVKAD